MIYKNKTQNRNAKLMLNKNEAIKTYTKKLTTENKKAENN